MLIYAAHVERRQLFFGLISVRKLIKNRKAFTRLSSFCEESTNFHSMYVINNANSIVYKKYRKKVLYDDIYEVCCDRKIQNICKLEAANTMKNKKPKRLENSQLLRKI